MNFKNMLLEEMEQLKKSNEFVKTKIAKFYNDPSLNEKERKKKNRESRFLGKFIESYNKKITITKSQESPDFEILLDGKTFGIEIKELEFNDKRRKGVLDKMFTEINKELKIPSNEFQGTYKITFRDPSLQFPNDIKQKVKEEILTLIKTNATEYNGEFIENIRKTRTNSGTVDVYESALGICPILSKETIIGNIEMKETKFQKYR
jgi:hypothetical protein